MALQMFQAQNSYQPQSVQPIKRDDTSSSPKTSGRLLINSLYMGEKISKASKLVIQMHSRKEIALSIPLPIPPHSGFPLPNQQHDQFYNQCKNRQTMGSLPRRGKGETGNSYTISLCSTCKQQDTSLSIYSQIFSTRKKHVFLLYLLHVITATMNTWVIEKSTVRQIRKITTTTCEQTPYL